MLSSPKRLVRIAANSLAAVERNDGSLVVRFSALSSSEGVVMRLSGGVGRRLPLPLFTIDHFLSA